MGLTMTVLGASGTYAKADGACTGYLLRSAETTVWLDCGPGTLGALQRHVDLADVDAIVVTHCHPDHWLELPVVYNAMKYYCHLVDLPVYGTAETREMFDAVCRQPRHPTFVWADIEDGGDLQIGDQRWRFGLTDHPVYTLATRVDAGGRSFLFSSDTGPDWRPGPLGDVDLALIEATLTTAEEGLGIPHISGREAGALARACGARSLMITHLAPGSEAETHRNEAAAAYGGPVELAVRHVTYTI